MKLDGNLACGGGMSELVAKGSDFIHEICLQNENYAIWINMDTV